ncbi:retrovirus-related pol polyprotein from transposon TNT 1-94 [Tanacetum coccineum]
MSEDHRWRLDGMQAAVNYATFIYLESCVKGYRLWDPTAHKVVVSRDVVFMEDKVQENEEGVSTTRETTTIQMEKEIQSNDSSEAVPQHEVNETTESQAPMTRTLDRERRRPGWQADYVMESNVAYCLLTEEGEPSTLQEALNNPDASFWKEAMQEEIEALHKNKTWELVPLPGGRKPIGNKWVYKIKRNGDDQVERYRARLVVKGYAQKEGIDFNEIFSPAPTKIVSVIKGTYLAREFEMKIGTQTRFWDANSPEIELVGKCALTEKLWKGKSCKVPMASAVGCLMFAMILDKTSHCTLLSGSSESGNVASTLKDGNALCCEAAVANESRKRFVDVWLFDTGATFHMTARREWFHQYKPISGGGSVYSCNDHELKIIGIGSIMVKMHDGTVHTIRDVRHVEGLKKNLLSLGQLDDLGCKLSPVPFLDLLYSDLMVSGDPITTKINYAMPQHVFQYVIVLFFALTICLWVISSAYIQLGSHRLLAVDFHNLDLQQTVSIRD